MLLHIVSASQSRKDASFAPYKFMDRIRIIFYLLNVTQRYIQITQNSINNNFETVNQIFDIASLLWRKIAVRLFGFESRRCVLLTATGLLQDVSINRMMNNIWQANAILHGLDDMTSVQNRSHSKSI